MRTTAIAEAGLDALHYREQSQDHEIAVEDRLRDLGIDEADLPAAVALIDAQAHREGLGMAVKFVAWLLAMLRGRDRYCAAVAKAVCGDGGEVFSELGSRFNVSKQSLQQAATRLRASLPENIAAVAVPEHSITRPDVPGHWCTRVEAAVAVGRGQEYLRALAPREIVFRNQHFIDKEDLLARHRAAQLAAARAEVAEDRQRHGHRG